MVVEDHLEPLGRLEGKNAAPHFDRRARQSSFVDHAARAVHDIHEKLAPFADAEKRSLPPGWNPAPVGIGSTIAILVSLPGGIRNGLLAFSISA